MGQLLLRIEASAAVQEATELPAHWDELDRDEQAEYIANKLADFVDAHVKPTYSVSE